MQRGFVSAEENEEIFRLYDNPDTPPNFNKLEQLFGEGKIQIRVERKSPKGTEEFLLKFLTSMRLEMANYDAVERGDS